MAIITGRAPYGARGLKWHDHRCDGRGARSRPVWGAWIEIFFRPFRGFCPCRRAPYGARGLKSLVYALFQVEIAVAPRMGRVD